MENLNEMARVIHQDNVDRGFYDEKHEIGTLLMLVVSELGEAIEADRKNRHANIEALYGNMAEGQDFQTAFKATMKDTFEDEIADTFIRLFDLSGYLGLDINTHVEKKLAYNKTRGYKHGKNY